MKMNLGKAGVILFVACALAMTGARAAETETGTKADPIKTVGKLVQRLTEANETYHGQTRATTLYVAPGTYDVSASYMPSYTKAGVQEDVSRSHLMVAGYTLSGTTTNPRDVVITCSHVSNPSNRLFILYLGGLEYLTVSNACLNGNGGGGVLSRTETDTDDVCRHVVLTDCEAAGDGGGSRFGSWYDCLYVNNKVNNGLGGAANQGYYENCTFTNNTATGRGGAIYSGATLINCKVVGNKVVGSADTVAGGGISGNGSAASACTMRGGELAYNTSTVQGGGSYCCKLFDVKVHHNTSTKAGGGIAGSADSKHDVASSTMRGGELAYNTSKADGGGSYDYNLYDVQVHHNTAAYSGGGAQINGSQVVSGCFVTNNTSKWAGGVRGCDQSMVTNTLIASNEAKKQGGGAYFSGTSSIIVDCVVSNNFANVPLANGDAQGGGVYLVGSCKIIHSRICHNRLWGINASQAVCGGGVYGGVATNCVIDGNAVMYPGATEYKANTYGGGTANTKLYECKIYNNALFGGRNGTGIYGGLAWKCGISNNVSGATSSSYSIYGIGPFDDCEINDGGVVNAILLNCRFLNCSNWVYLAKGANCATNGWFDYRPTMLFDSCATNCLFANMYFPSSIFAYATKKGSALVNCTITGYRTSYMLYAEDNANPMLVENCIFTGNYCGNGTSEVNLSAYSAARTACISLVNNVVGPGRNDGWGTPGSEVNTYDLTGDVKFVGGDGADAYALRFTSPARGKGVVRSWMTGATDIRCSTDYPRLRDGKVDAGCYQCWLDPAATMLLIR